VFECADGYTYDFDENWNATDCRMPENCEEVKYGSCQQCIAGT